MMNEKKLINQELVNKVKEYKKIMEYPNFKRFSFFGNEETTTTVSSSPADNSKFIDNVCLSYRHDFGLLSEEKRDEVRDECKWWLIAIENTKRNEVK